MPLPPDSSDNKLAQPKPSEPRSPEQRMKINQTINAMLISETSKEAADVLGMSVSGLYHRFEIYPEIREKIAEQYKLNPELAQAVIRRNTLKASQKLAQTLESSKEALVLKAAQEILDRAGVGKASVSQKEGGANVQVNVLNHLKEQLDEYDF